MYNICQVSLHNFLEDRGYLVWLHVQFNSVPPDRGAGGGGMRDDLTVILFQSFLREAIISSSGMDRDAHSLQLFIQDFLCGSTILDTKILVSEGT